MAEVWRASGKVEKLVDTGLESLQRAVGGWIEPVPLRDGRLMYVNEEGKMKGLPVNVKAWEETVRNSWLPPEDVIVGDVVVLSEAEACEDEEV